MSLSLSLSLTLSFLGQILWEKKSRRKNVKKHGLHVLVGKSWIYCFYALFTVLNSLVQNPKTSLSFVSNPVHKYLEVHFFIWRHFKYFHDNTLFVLVLVFVLFIERVWLSDLLPHLPPLSCQPSLPPSISSAPFLTLCICICSCICICICFYISFVFVFSICHVTPPFPLLFAPLPPFCHSSNKFAQKSIFSVG